MKNNRLRLVAAFLMVTTMVVIFIFSSQSSAVSYQISESVSQAVRAVPDKASLEYRETHPAYTVNYTLFGKIETRKLAHILLYALLTIFTYLACRPGLWRPPLVLAVDYLYACSDEIHQHFAGRTGTFNDTLIDGSGIVIALLICLAITLWINYRKKKRHERI